MMGFLRLSLDDFFRLDYKTLLTLMNGAYQPIADVLHMIETTKAVDPKKTKRKIPSFNPYERF